MEDVVSIPAGFYTRVSLSWSTCHGRGWSRSEGRLLHLRVSVAEITLQDLGSFLHHFPSRWVLHDESRRPIPVPTWGAEPRGRRSFMRSLEVENQGRGAGRQCARARPHPNGDIEKIRKHEALRRKVKVERGRSRLVLEFQRAGGDYPC